MKKLIALSIVAATVAGCGGTAAGENEYTELAARAENEIRLAAKTGFLWLNTERLMQESKAAHAAGERDKAMDLARRAIDEAVLAQQQARDNARPKADFGARP